MRRRPGGAVRVLDRCARCGGNLPAYNVERVVTHLPTGLGGALVRHELVVCTSCQVHFADRPTAMERAALALDGASAVDRMEFFQAHRAEVVRVQQTAAYFLGADVCAQLAEPLRAEERARRERNGVWRERYRERLGAEMAGVPSDEEDDDLPF